MSSTLLTNFPLPQCLISAVNILPWLKWFCEIRKQQGQRRAGGDRATDGCLGGTRDVARGLGKGLGIVYVCI